MGLRRHHRDPYSDNRCAGRRHVHASQGFSPERLKCPDYCVGTGCDGSFVVNNTQRMIRPDAQGPNRKTKRTAHARRTSDGRRTVSRAQGVPSASSYLRSRGRHLPETIEAEAKHAQCQRPELGRRAAESASCGHPSAPTTTKTADTTVKASRAAENVMYGQLGCALKSLPLPARGHPSVPYVRENRITSFARFRHTDLAAAARVQKRNSNRHYPPIEFVRNASGFCCHLETRPRRTNGFVNRHFNSPGISVSGRG